jgi:hypothetical protein
MAQTSNDGKLALRSSKKAPETRRRWSSGAVKLYFRRVRYQSKILVFTYSTFYLIRHWFDFFCYPWKFDDIFMGQNVPYAVGIPIFVGAVAWTWRHCRRRAKFWALCFTTVVVFATEVYFRVYVPGNELWRPFSLKSPLACGLVLLSAVLGDLDVEPEESSTAPADYSEEDTEAARDAKSLSPHAAPPQISPDKTQSKISSLMARIYRRLPTIGTAATMAFIAAVATAFKHPPTFEFADVLLAELNCKAQTTKLDFDNQHFQFTATNTFLRSCSPKQQLYALEQIMSAHINASDATCGVYCVRRAEEDGQLFGYISQVRGGLVDMYYCRGGYGSFGTDCEAEGEEYGYDVSKEGWMDDIGEPWSVLQEDTGETLPPDEW